MASSLWNTLITSGGTLACNENGCFLWDPKIKDDRLPPGVKGGLKWFPRNQHTASLLASNKVFNPEEVESYILLNLPSGARDRWHQFRPFPGEPIHVGNQWLKEGLGHLYKQNPKAETISEWWNAFSGVPPSTTKPAKRY